MHGDEDAPGSPAVDLQLVHVGPVQGDLCLLGCFVCAAYGTQHQRTPMVHEDPTLRPRLGKAEVPHRIDGAAVELRCSGVVLELEQDVCVLLRCFDGAVEVFNKGLLAGALWLEFEVLQRPHCTARNSGFLLLLRGALPISQAVVHHINRAIRLIHAFDECAPATIAALHAHLFAHAQQRRVMVRRLHWADAALLPLLDLSPLGLLRFNIGLGCDRRCAAGQAAGAIPPVLSTGRCQAGLSVPHTPLPAPHPGLVPMKGNKQGSGRRPPSGMEGETKRCVGP
mmetsp:Transcript_2083/g.5765  ORF Transcript_2083/g.5765 Transcript_2083/m.5765 type:complete len:282 (+) Transcript_2083:146-991(+)